MYLQVQFLIAVLDFIQVWGKVIIHYLMYDFPEANPEILFALTLTYDDICVNSHNEFMQRQAVWFKYNQFFRAKSGFKHVLTNFVDA